MKNLKISLCLFVSLVANDVLAQKVKFGKVSEAELREEVYEKDSSAVAAVLYRYKNIRFEYKQSLGFKLVTSIHERVKIYKSEGFEYATVIEKLSKDNGDKETISGLKAFTYSLENGEIKKHKLSKEGEFKTELNEYYNEEKFTMPNVKVGSVVEYEYQIHSPFYWIIDEIAMQYDIPIKYQEISIRAPEYFVFKPTMKGYLPLNPQTGTEGGTITFTDKQRRGKYNTTTTYSNSNLNYIINVTNYTMQDVPALKEEPHVNNMNNYRSAVLYELQYTKFPQSPIKSYTTTWEKVIKTIYESRNFGGQLAQKRYFKEDLQALIGDRTDEVEKAAIIFQYVQNHMNWNGMAGFYSDKGVKKAYEDRSGNIADINLMLTAMLSEAGLEANPVLISTRDHGVPMFPTRRGFNYVVASVSLNDNIVLLDASNKYTKPNVLPVHALNWYGKLIKKDGSFNSVSVMPKIVSKENSNCTVALDQNGGIKGRMRKTYTDFKAYEFRNKFNGIQEDSYLEKLESSNVGMEIGEYAVKNNETIGKAIMENMSFTMEGQIAKVGDKMYFNPLFTSTMTENPFKLDERNYPIDYAYPWEEKMVVNISIPEGYEIETLPADVKLGLPNKTASFIYKVMAQGNKIQVLADLKMNAAIIPAVDYHNLKEFYKKIVEKEAEKVVLSKTTANGSQETPAGSR
ncbi:transglutaminase domain-containing protein [Ulvibacterium sp.]|uniref:transglutaminase domain-containing protein n=1 Tax=Ulvibacterium sp. TaxID=2665914 RepID=UPI003CC5922A